MQLCLAMRGLPADTAVVIRVLLDGGEVGRIELSMESRPPGAAPQEVRPLPMQAISGGWTVAAAPIPKTPTGFLLSSPGNYRLVSEAPDGMEITVGEFDCYLAKVPPLTPERIAAIRSDPYAAKAVRLELGCRSCTTKLRAYAGIERVRKLEAEGDIWFGELPDRFECSCKSTRFDLDSIRSGLHVALGVTVGSVGSTNLIPLYNRDALLDICRKFSTVLDKNPKEEVIQDFIKENPLLLHQFPSTRILIKPKILTFFSADFAILTTQKELVLIEIEKANTRLLKKDGDEAADLTHAFDQVRNWLHVVAEHRLAVLAALEIQSGDVTGISRLRKIGQF